MGENWVEILIFGSFGLKSWVSESWTVLPSCTKSYPLIPSNIKGAAKTLELKPDPSNIEVKNRN